MAVLFFYTASVPDYWIGIDQGSTATKACLMNRRGQMRRVVSAPVATRRPAPGLVEHDAEALYRSVRLVLGGILRGVSPHHVRAIGLACQRSTCLFWDARTGRPLTPALSWQDRRGEALCATLCEHAGSIAGKTGLRLNPHYAASKARWLLDRSPDLRRRAERGAARFGTLDSFLLFRMTRGQAWSTDPTHAARTLLMDLSRLDWDSSLLELFRIPPRALPPIRPSAFPAGIVRIGGTRVRLAATLGDQQAALIGVGGTAHGAMVLNYGTGAFAALNTGARPQRVPGLLTSVAWSTEKETRYILEGTVNSAGSALAWIRGLTEPPAQPRYPLDLSRLPILIPALAGLAAPHWRADTGAAIFDLHLSSSSRELEAATLAGIACRVREIVDRMEERGNRPRRILVSGGLARSTDLLRLQANLLGRPIFPVLGEQATARGAALLARDGGKGGAPGDGLRHASSQAIRPAGSRESARDYFRRFESRMKLLLSDLSPASDEVS